MQFIQKKKKPKLYVILKSFVFDKVQVDYNNIIVYNMTEKLGYKDLKKTNQSIFVKYIHNSVLELNIARYIKFVE